MRFISTRAFQAVRSFTVTAFHNSLCQPLFAETYKNKITISACNSIPTSHLASWLYVIKLTGMYSIFLLAKYALVKTGHFWRGIHLSKLLFYICHSDWKIKSIFQKLWWSKNLWKFHWRGMVTSEKEAIVTNILASNIKSESKRKEFAPLVANPFLKEWTPFRIGIVYRKANRMTHQLTFFEKRQNIY